MFGRVLRRTAAPSFVPPLASTPWRRDLRYAWPIYERGGYPLRVPVFDNVFSDVKDPRMILLREIWCAHSLSSEDLFRRTRATFEDPDGYRLPELATLNGIKATLDRMHKLGWIHAYHPYWAYEDPARSRDRVYCLGKNIARDVDALATQLGTTHLREYDPQHLPKVALTRDISKHVFLMREHRSKVWALERIRHMKDTDPMLAHVYMKIYGYQRTSKLSVDLWNTRARHRMYLHELWKMALDPDSYMKNTYMFRRWTKRIINLVPDLVNTSVADASKVSVPSPKAQVGRQMPERQTAPQPGDVGGVFDTTPPQSARPTSSSVLDSFMRQRAESAADSTHGNPATVV